MKDSFPLTTHTPPAAISPRRWCTSTTASRGLRLLEAAGHRRQRQDRHRAIRIELAWSEAEGRLRARSRRLPDLFRSQRRRLLRGRHLSARAVPPQGWRAARQRDGYGGVSRRSALSRMGFGKGLAPASDERSQNTAEDTGAADLLCRRSPSAEQSERPRSARSLARRAAADVSHRPRTGGGALAARFRLVDASGLRRDRAHSRRRISGPVGHVRQSSRRLGERRGRPGQRRWPLCSRRRGRLPNW